MVGTSSQMYSVVPITRNLCLMSGTATQARRSDFCKSNRVQFIEIIGSSENVYDEPLNISTIMSFSETAFKATEQIDGPTVVCPGMDHPKVLARTCELVCAYLVLRLHFDSNRALNAVKEIIQGIPFHPSKADVLKNSLYALERANALQWLDRSPDPARATNFDLQMSNHYSDPANGSIITLVPGKLLLFPTPCALPAGQTHAD